jgi:hypothetical protein
VPQWGNGGFYWGQRHDSVTLASRGFVVDSGIGVFVHMNAIPISTALLTCVSCLDQGSSPLFRVVRCVLEPALNENLTHVQAPNQKICWLLTLACYGGGCRPCWPPGRFALKLL